jgi:hypothetical protein
MVPIVSSVAQAKAVLEPPSTGPTARAAWRWAGARALRDAQRALLDRFAEQNSAP